MTTKHIKNLYPAIKTQLIKIISRSLREARVPQNMRNIWITPIPKKGKADSPEDCRPINLTSILLKLMEKVIIEQVLSILGPIGRDVIDLDELEDNGFFSNRQDGFRKHRGTTQGYIKISQVIQTIMASSG